MFPRLVCMGIMPIRENWHGLGILAKLIIDILIGENPGDKEGRGNVLEAPAKAAVTGETPRKHLPKRQWPGKQLESTRQNGSGWGNASETPAKMAATGEKSRKHPPKRQ